MSKSPIQVIAEAGTAYAQTGLTPLQLVKQRDELLEALKGARMELNGIADYLADTKNVDAMQIAGDMVASNPKTKDVVRDIDDLIARIEGKPVPA